MNARGYVSRLTIAAVLAAPLAASAQTAPPAPLAPATPVPSAGGPWSTRVIIDGQTIRRFLATPSPRPSMKVKAKPTPRPSGGPEVFERYDSRPR